MLPLHAQTDMADNIDLLRVVQEFEEGYEMKYGKRPRLVKKQEGGADLPAALQQVRWGVHPRWLMASL